MRRPARWTMALLAAMALAAVSFAQSTETTNATAPAQPAQEQEAPTESQSTQQFPWFLIPKRAPTPPKPAPETVFVPEGTRFAVVLNTPLSTRMTKKGESVTFLVSEPVYVGQGLEIPPDTRITGTVTEAKRPGIFGSAGKLKVKVNHLELPTGGGANIVAQLQSADPSATRAPSDHKGANVLTLAQWTLQGTLIGRQIKGGKGAAIGAGAGAAAALIIMMSRRGPDLYLEPGTPFEVVLDRPIELRGWDVQVAQAQSPPSSRANATVADQEDETYTDVLPGEDAELTTNRPKLKRRPKRP